MTELLEPHYAGARWRGPVPNKVAGGMVLPYMGVVMHRQQGTEAGTDAWFHNPASEVSAHCGFPYADQLGNPVMPDQWVAYNDRAWAEVNGNDRWLSWEFEGFASDKLDANQIAQAGLAYADLHRQLPEQFPLRTTHSVKIPGFGTHRMGGNAWGGHLGCPGDKAAKQRPAILARALLAANPTSPLTPKPSPVEAVPDYPGHLLEVAKPSMAGKAVLQLTQHLEARGWKIKPTSTYTRTVAKTVRAFQKQKHLLPDGVVGPVTWYAIWHLPVTR